MKDKIKDNYEWHDINTEPIPTLTFHDKDETLYIVKPINNGKELTVTGTEISIDMAGGCFYKYWRYIK